jgi:hypothetical protein
LSKTRVSEMIAHGQIRSARPEADVASRRGYPWSRESGDPHGVGGDRFRR